MSESAIADLSVRTVDSPQFQKPGEASHAVVIGPGMRQIDFPDLTCLARERNLRTEVARERNLRNEVARERNLRNEVARERNLRNEVARERNLRNEVARDQASGLGKGEHPRPFPQRVASQLW